MPAKVIVALDFNEISQAQNFLTQVEPNLCKVKIGKAMFTRFGPEWVKQIVGLGFDVFLDLKFHDIPNTVEQACHAAADLGVWMVNVHALGGLKMLQAAKAGVSRASHQPKLIAVTILTSLQAQDCMAIGLPTNVQANVERLALLSQQAGLDGVVCSAQEARSLRAKLGPEFLLVTPGIRLETNKTDDQQRIMTPETAMQQGASYLVIGRPITQAADPKSVLQAINASF
ncbi:MAG: orotidine-5'-phosphate decarboxylase [Pseudomonadota bacterium]